MAALYIPMHFIRHYHFTRIRRKSSMAAGLSVTEGSVEGTH